MYYSIDLNYQEGNGFCDPPLVEEPTAFIRGRPLVGAFELPLECPTEATGEQDFADRLCRRFPIVSQRMARALRDAGLDNIEEFPAELINVETDERWKGFLVLNIIVKISCVNLMESTGDVIGGGLIAYNKMVLNKAVINRHLLFRVAEASATIILHESIKNALDAIRPPLKGIEYNAVEIA